MNKIKNKWKTMRKIYFLFKRYPVLLPPPDTFSKFTPRIVKGTEHWGHIYRVSSKKIKNNL